jgi:hypothetical protein
MPDAMGVSRVIDGSGGEGMRRNPVVMGAVRVDD